MKKKQINTILKKNFKKYKNIKNRDNSYKHIYSRTKLKY